MVTGLDARGLILVSKLRRDTALWVPWTEPPTGRPGRPRKYAGRFDRTRSGELPVVELPDEGRRLYHAQLYYKPFGKLLRVVFVLDADEDPAEVRKPITLFATDPEMAPKRIYRIHVERFHIEFNFRDYRQHLGLAALAWTRLELRHAAARALDRFSMANVKPRISWKWCWPGFWRWSGRTGPCGNAPRPCGNCSPWTKSSPNPPESTANPGRIRRRRPQPGHPNPDPARRGDCSSPFNISKTVHTIASGNRLSTSQSDTARASLARWVLQLTLLTRYSPQANAKSRSDQQGPGSKVGIRPGRAAARWTMPVGNAAGPS